jgi:uncharacterized protein YndB with AHSA1/START domain
MDTIAKSTVAPAPRARVWSALSDYRQFGEWFKCAFDEPFVAGKKASGRITYPGYEHVKMEIWIEAIEPEHRFSFRWHPYAIDPNVDYSKEPTTLVTFSLADAAGGTRLEVTESGFDQIPEARRQKALEMNSGGWEQQMKNIADYVKG